MTSRAGQKAGRRAIKRLLRLITDERHITAQAVTSLYYVSTEYAKLNADQIDKFSPAWCENIKTAISILTQALAICERLHTRQSEGQE